VQTIQTDSNGFKPPLELTVAKDFERKRAQQSDSAMKQKTAPAWSTAILFVASISLFLETSGFARPCPNSLSTLEMNFAPDFSRGTFQVFANSGCAWQAEVKLDNPADEWLLISSGQNGNGNAEVEFYVYKNYSIKPREAAIKVGDQTLKVFQHEAVCPDELRKTSELFPKAGGTGSFDVTTLFDCTWTAISPVDWIVVTSPTGSVTNYGTVKYQVLENRSNELRSAIISVGARSFTVFQNGQDCPITLSSSGIALDWKGGKGKLNITTEPGCAWRAELVQLPSSSWRGNTMFAFIDSEKEGMGSGEITFTVMELNVWVFMESSVIKVGNQKFRIDQTGAPCSNELLTDTRFFNASGGFGWGTVSTPLNCWWHFDSTNEWIMPNSMDHEDPGSEGFEVLPNTDPGPRTGYITAGGNQVTIYQAGTNCYYSFSARSAYFGKSGGTGSVDVATSSDCAWMLELNGTEQEINGNWSEWLVVTNKGGLGNASVAFTITPNPFPSPRTATITLGNQTFTVEQGIDDSPNVDIALYAGINVSGTVGLKYQVLYRDELGQPEWTPLSTFTLDKSPKLYIDESARADKKRFYKAVIVQP
jgi:hypothetical protein